MAVRIVADQLDRLFDAIRADGYELIGPTIRDGAILLDKIRGVVDLPRGFTDEQEKGHYRLKRTGGPALFGFNAPAQTFRKYLQPAAETVFRATRSEPGGGIRFEREALASARLALVGVKACDLAAIGVQDVVFGCRKNPKHPPHAPEIQDPHYVSRRENVLIIATECSQAGSTCFCASMDTGPEIEGGYDLRITEFDGDEHWLLIDAGTDRGRHLLNSMDSLPATEMELRIRSAQLAKTRASMGRSLDTEGLPQALASGLNSPRWDQVAERCLSCANCTLSCPTCFCTDVQDSTDVTGRETRRIRSWDSCFNKDISWLHGGHIRKSTASRYRQWLVHKLSTWHEQFGSSGCVGCGRCIAWCPVGIDITEEAEAIMADGQRTQ